MPEWISPDREQKFPNLTRSIYEKTSDETEFNNCVAWAAGDAQGWWQPPKESWHYWPKGAPTNAYFESFVIAYELSGFEKCPDATPEVGYDKLAIYVYDNDRFAHAAKQIETGWSSKLGDYEDIRHDTLTALEGPFPAYGYVRVFMRRPISYVQV